MTRITTTDLANFHRHALGADRVIARIIESMGNPNAPQSNYPPFNVVKITDDETEVQVAVAGFTPEELEVKIENGTLVITGEKAEPQEEVEYVYHGISARKFMRYWTLADDVEVLDATVKHGILSVRVRRLNPERLQAKVVPITYVA